MAPLDEQAENRTGLVKAARIFSNVVSPPVVFATIALALALNALPFWPGLAWAAVYGFFVSLLPILFVLWLLHTGRIAELHMSNTKERLWPYVSAVLGSIIVYALVVSFDGPEIFRCLAIFNGITLAALGVINTFWLISFHATAVSAALTITWFVFGQLPALFLFPLILLVIIVRLYLKRHTPAQVAAGLLLGIATVWSLTVSGCFLI